MLSEIKYQIGENDEHILAVSRALSSPQRLDILKLLNTKSLSVRELAKLTKAPVSTTSLNVAILNECGLIKIEEIINKNGKVKLCSREVDNVFVNLHAQSELSKNKLHYDIPIGNYSSYDVDGGCGMATKIHNIGLDNDESVFYSSERFQAGLIWFKKGFLEYRISNRNIPKKLEKINISFEACSEAPFYRNDWKSNISLLINNIEVGTFLSPGDFGGRIGKQNPKWWPSQLTQYGTLINFEITNNGSFINNQKVSDICISDCNIKDNNYISFKIGVKENAEYVGGINIFGSCFGDYNQDICVDLEWN